MVEACFGKRLAKVRLIEFPCRRNFPLRFFLWFMTPCRMVPGFKRLIESCSMCNSVNYTQDGCRRSLTYVGNYLPDWTVL